MLNKLKSILPPKLKLAAILSISFSSAFLVFIYTPFDIYLNNPSDFVVSWRLMLPPLLIVFLICFLILSFILFMMWHKKIIIGLVLLALCGVFFAVARFYFLPLQTLLIVIAVAMTVWVLMLKFLKEESADVVMLVLLGLIVAAYVQTLFLNNNMVSIMGQQTFYSERSTGNIINMLIWAAIALIPLSAFIVFKIMKKDFRYEKIFISTLVILSGMQITGLTVTAVTTDLPEGYDQDPVYFSYEAMVNFNPDENIIVFVIDTLDTRIINATFDNYPHLWDYLEGFTYYTNNTAEYFDTVASMTSMLTRHHILPWENGWTYIERAWDRHTFIDTLRENGFSSNLYLDMNCTFNRYGLIKDRVDNTAPVDSVSIRPRPFLSISTRLSLGRVSPYLLKNTWLSTIRVAFNREFVNVDLQDDITSFIPIVDIHSDIRVHNFLMQADFSVNSEKNVFILMFINGPHANGDRNDPSSYGIHYDEESGYIRYGGDRVDITRANFETLNLYFQNMKEIGVYDNSTIIITGDHGLRDTIPETTALFIKPKGSSGSLAEDSITELSHLYFQSSILDAAGLPFQQYGVSYFDIINGLTPAPHKRILFVKGLNSATPNARIHGDYGVWEVVGDANAAENWTFVPWDPLDFFP